MKKHKLSSFLRWTTCNSLRAMLLATTLSLLAGCSTDNGESRRNSLPQGKYPLTFSTAVEGLSVTRATTAEGVWTVDDPVTVRVGDVAKKYKPTSGSPSTTLQADVAPFYWQSASETKAVSAWYLGTGYQEELPATWTVQTDQNADNAAGYQQSDFLYAPETSISFADRSKASLTFHHQTAKVVINILNAKAVTSADQIAAVGLVNMHTTAGYAVPQSPNTAGTWIPTSSGTTPNSITPKSLALAPGTAGNILKSYAALVIPQDMGGKPFIKVTAHGNDYYYTPTADEANLRSGQQYTYNITVKHGYLEVVAVSEDGGAWSEDGVGEEIQSLAVGDFYMKDGSLIAGNTETLTEEQKANCIGIVFWVGDPTARDKTLKADHPNCTHGLVVALKDAIDTPEGTTKWQEPANSVQEWLNSNRPGKFLIFFKADDGIEVSQPYNNIQGYNNTKAIEEYNNNSGLAPILPVVVAVVDYRKNAAAIAPVHSSNWYLPSSKELTLLCGKDVPDIGYDFPGTDTRDLLNGIGQTSGQFAKLGDFAEKIKSEDNGIYWSSTEFDNSSAFGVDFSYGVPCNRSKEGDYYRVRCILAF